MILLLQNFRMSLAELLRWWVHTLMQLIPASLRRLLYTQKPRLFVSVENFQLRLFCIANDVELTLFKGYLHQEGKQSLSAFFHDHPQWRNAEKILVLNTQQALKKRLDLPLATQANLLQVLAYEFDRYTPFQSDACYFSAQVIERNKNLNRLSVELIYITKTRLQMYFQELKSFGIQINSAMHASDMGAYQTMTYRQNYNLLPDELQVRSNKELGVIKQVLLCCFCLLMGSSILLPFYFQQRQIDGLQSQIVKLKDQAETVQALKIEAQLLSTGEQKVATLKHEAPVILNIIEQLSKLLPQDTWLRSFDYRDNKFILEGLSASSSALISVLEASPTFAKTTMVSPVLQNFKDKLDQFQLETQLENKHEPR